MHWYGAADAKDYLIVVFVVANAANSAASTILSYEGSLFLIHLFDLLLELHPLGLTVHALVITHAFHAVHLVQDLSVLHVVAPLLRELEFLQEVVL